MKTEKRRGGFAAMWRVRRNRKDVAVSDPEIFEPVGGLNLDKYTDDESRAKRIFFYYACNSFYCPGMAWTSNTRSTA